MRYSALATAVLVLVLTCFAQARDIYVNNMTGADELSGRAAEPSGTNGPVASICKALRLAAPGDRIVLANTGEPYREQVSIFGCDLFGYEDRPLTLSGNHAVLDGTVVAAPGAWRHVAGDVFAMRPRRLAYQQLFSGGNPLTRVQIVALHGVQAALQPKEWAYLDGRVLFRVEKDHLPDLYDLRHAGLQTGITLYNTRGVVIENLVVQGFQQDGINAHELVRDCVLRGVECRANGRSGLSVGGVSRVRVEQSGFYDNGRAQVRAEGHSEVEITGSDIEAENGVSRYGLRGGLLKVDGQLVTVED